jgi:hypothetical protein
MKRTAILTLVFGMLATSASAEPFGYPGDRSSAPIYTAQLADGGDLRSHLLYEGPGGTVNDTYVTAAGGFVSTDDYNTVLSPGGTAIMESFRFVGGVAQAGGIVFFQFFDVNSYFVASFGAQLPVGNPALWQVVTPNLVIPTGGFVKMWADDGSVQSPTTGMWLAASGAPAVGTTGPTLPGITEGGVVLNHSFAITVPEPGTLALFGMGVLTLVTRRRR